MNIFRKTAIAAALCLISIASNAGNIEATAIANGSSSALSLNAYIAPTSNFIGNNSKLYLAIVMGNGVYFYSDTAGFVPYAGGLAALTGPNPAEATPVRAITKSTEEINLAGNASGVVGADVYVGYGTSFAELISSGRYAKKYTIESGNVRISSTRTGIAADSNAAYTVCNDNMHNWASLETEYAYVDKLKAAGYSGITMEFNVNVAANGEVLNTKPSQTHERMWTIMAYAKSIGLTPNLKVHWGVPSSPGISENSCGNLNTWTTPVNGFDMNLFLTGVKAHFAEYAPKAQAAGVKLMFLGTENDNLVTAQYHAQWADIVATIRASYKGVISYDANYLGVTYQPMEQVAIWDLVDKIGISFYPSLQPTPASTVAEVVEKYVSRPAQYCSSTKCDNTYAIPNIVQHIRALSARYGKEVIFGEINWAAYELTLAGFVEPQSLQAQGKLVLNENQRQLAYGAFFEVMNNPNYLGGVITGVNIWGYDFWQTRPGMPALWVAAMPLTELLGTPTEAMIKPFITCNKSACP